jgi:hypothetical protein
MVTLAVAAPREGPSAGTAIRSTGGPSGSGAGANAVGAGGVGAATVEVAAPGFACGWGGIDAQPATPASTRMKERERGFTAARYRNERRRSADNPNHGA